MPYVMVPVPEEYVEDVMQLILRASARASIGSWDADAVGEVFAAIDEPSRALLAYTARAVLAGHDFAEEEAVRAIQLSAREILGIARELNDIARDRNLPMLVSRRVITERLPNGRTTEKRVFTMDDDLAVLVRDAERNDMLQDPVAPSGESS